MTDCAGVQTQRRRKRRTIGIRDGGQLNRRTRIDGPQQIATPAARSTYTDPNHPMVTPFTSATPFTSFFSHTIHTEISADAAQGP